MSELLGKLAFHKRSGDLISGIVVEHEIKHDYTYGNHSDIVTLLDERFAGYNYMNGQPELKRKFTKCFVIDCIFMDNNLTNRIKLSRASINHSFESIMPSDEKRLKVRELKKCLEK